MAVLIALAVMLARSVKTPKKFGQQIKSNGLKLCATSKLINQSELRIELCKYNLLDLVI